MHIDLRDLSPNQVYFNMIQTLIPRPIAWVLSENEGGSYNLAPFSYFNAVCSDPPLVMISVGKQMDGSHKDTRVNIEARKDFVVHIVHREQLQAMNASSATLPPEVSEVKELGLETTAMEGSRLPRLRGSRVAYACELYDILEIGNGPQSVILGRVNGIFIDDAVADVNEKGRLKVDAAALDPIGRLGASEYVTFGDVVRIARPK